MCIMASPVAEVSNTNICVSSHEGRQIVVYGMSVELYDSNAMILPVPVGPEGAEAIHLHDLSKVPAFFNVLRDIFEPRSRGFSRNSMPADMLGGGTLKVHKVGNYDVSIVPTVDDVKRLNRLVFSLSPETEATLRANYPQGFAFVVAQLQKSGEFHPLAYSHPMVGDAMFVPTRHEHGEGDDTLPEWDHRIYSYDTSVTHGLTPMGRSHGEVRIQSSTEGLDHVAWTVERGAPELAGFFQNKTRLVYFRASGQLPNNDITVSL